MKKLITLTFLLFAITGIKSQNQEQIEKIINTYDLTKINDLRIKYNNLYKKDKAYAIEMATINNWSITYNKNGIIGEIQRIRDGKPVYYETSNSNAARSTRASFLHNNGGLGLNIEGQGMNAFVWDGGHALYNHAEFVNSGTSKIIDADNDPVVGGGNRDHATHVMGTILAKGNNTNAKGMAPKASGYAFSWNNDLSEVLSAVGFGMLFSNHSYGFDIALLSDWSIGAYNGESAAWDEVLFNSPYYLMVCAAGNDGFDFTSNSTPLENNFSYDKLYGQTTAKNTMVVANGHDANINAQGDIISGGNINTGSSQGPTDDYRIKPDITGNGTNLYSPISTSIISYDTYTGTSMASPNVYGSLLLLQQLYNQENNNFMLAATVKGLALHTADDRGTFGPDAKYGWGYMNTKKSAEVILNSNVILEELSLTHNETKTFQVNALGSEPLIASISWTDPKGTNINTGTANDNTPVLVNDLDIRVSKSGTTYFPWKLTSVTTNTQGDNIVDPYEKIEINNPTSMYTITISHKGTLSQSQNYSLIVTGISSSTLSLNTNPILGFEIYPNPTNNGIVNFTFNNIDNNTTITLTNIIGKTIIDRLSTNLDSIQQFDFSNLEKGIYFVTLTNNNRKITKKLIIN